MDIGLVNIYIKELVDNTENNINGAVILQKNGHLINSILPEEIDENKIALIGTILVSSGERACDELNKGNLEQIVVNGDFGKLILISNGNNEFIGALGPIEANFDNILMELKLMSDLIERIQNILWL